MKRIYLAFIPLLMVLHSKAAENQLDYLWNTNSVHYAFENKIDLSLSEKVHYNLNVQGIEFYYFDCTLTHPVSNYFSTGIGLRHLQSKQINDWKVENRLMIYFNYQNNNQFINLNLNNRISYQQYPQAKDNLRYYHKLTLLHPGKVFSGNIQPYLAEEVFIKLNNENFHMWRAYAGLKLLASKPVSFDLFWSEEFRKNQLKAWNYFGIIGANINLKLNQ